MKLNTNFCVMCKKFKERAFDSKINKEVLVYFIDPTTKEQMCSECNAINNSIYADKGKKDRGIMHSEIINIKILEDKDGE
jgi:hypothetical protein